MSNLAVGVIGQGSCILLGGGGGIGLGEEAPDFLVDLKDMALEQLKLLNGHAQTHRVFLRKHSVNGSAN